MPRFAASRGLDPLDATETHQPILGGRRVEKTADEVHAVEAVGHDLPARSDFLDQPGGEGVFEFLRVGLTEVQSEATLEAGFVDEAVVQGVEEVFRLCLDLR